MAYQEFAYFYDEFNGAADYDALFAYVTGELKAHGIQDGIVADFGCGTGELTLMLAQAGYDMIGIDVSEEMLSVLRDKADALGLPLTNPMLLCQDLLQLDLYGTIRAAVSTFDTYNHIGPLENFEKAIAKAAFFMEKDGVFVFDLNTPYKCFPARLLILMRMTPPAAGATAMTHRQVAWTSALISTIKIPGKTSMNLSRNTATRLIPSKRC